MKTYYPKPGDVARKWYLIDLKGKTLGRAATKISELLCGKHKVQYAASANTGDFIVAINSDHIKLTGNKWDDKIYHRHTGHVGGIRSITAAEQLKKDSTKMIYSAVKGMLPRNNKGNKLIKHLKVYGGTTHENEAQKPDVLEI